MYISPAIDNYPQGQILREDDHQFRRTGYFQVTSQNFSYEGYDRGTQQQKKQHGIRGQLARYFAKRHFLFSKFDQGVQLDQESWYSVIPEPVSHYLRQRLLKAKVKRIFQPFCGVGGIAVHLAKHFKDYVANDIDPNKLEMLKNNLTVYGKSPQSITLLNQDFLQVEPFKTDAVLICPPWGGPDTSLYASQDLDDLMEPQLTAILSHALQFSQQILLQMPKHTSLPNLLTVAHRAGLRGVFTVERIETNERCSQLFIYFGRESFTGMSSLRLQALLLADCTLPGKVDRKRLKILLKENSPELLSQVYKARFPNKRITLI